MERSIDIVKYSMDNSRFITIGYTYGFERKLYEFLKDYNTVYINELDLTDGYSILDKIKILKRNNIIDCVLDPIYDMPLYSNSETYYVINLVNIVIPIRTNESLTNYSKNLDVFIQNLRRDAFDLNIKIILLSPTYTNFNGGSTFKGSNSPLYVSDLVLTYSEDGDLKIVKNRHGHP